MTRVSFTGQFDNGHDYYYCDADIEIATDKTLSIEDIVYVVEELEREDVRKHGRSYRGRVIGFHVSNDEFDIREEKGLITRNQDDELIIGPELQWLNFSADRKDISRAFQLIDDEYE